MKFGLVFIERAVFCIAPYLEITHIKETFV